MNSPLRLIRASILSAALVALIALILPLPGRGQTVVGAITRPGLVPRAVAVYEGGNRAFVADNSTGNVYIYDGTTNAEIGSIAAGTFVQDMLVNEATGKLYIASAGANKLFIVNAATGAHITDYTGVIVGTQIAQDAGLGKVYATFNGLQQIDVVTDARTGVGGILGVDMAVNTVTHEVFITSGVNNTLQIVNGMTLDVTTINNLGGEGIAVTPVNNKAYITFCENDAMGRPHSCIYNRNTNMSSLVDDANDAVEAFYSAATNRVYTSSEVDAYSTIIDGATDASFNLPMPQATISLGFRNETKRVYYAALKFVGVLDEETQLLERIPINNPFADQGGIIISDVAVNQTTGRVYVINDSRLDFVTVVQDTEKLTRPPVYMGSRGFPSRILVMDPTSKTTIEVWSLPDAFQSNETMTVRPGGGRLYVPRSSPFGQALQVYTGAGTKTFLRSFTTGGNGPVSAAFTPDGSRVFVTNSSSNNVSVMNVADDSIVTTVMTGSTPFGAVVTPDGSKVYVANRGSGSVTVINTASNTVTTTITVGTSPWGVAVNPAGTKVYVANSGSATVSVISTATNSVIATVPVGMTPHYLAVSPDGKNVYIGNRGSGTVSVISTGTDAVIDTLTVGANPEGIGVLPDGSEVFVVSSNTTGPSSVSVIQTSDHSVTSVPLPAEGSQETVGLAIADPSSKFAGRATSGNGAVNGAVVRALQSGVEKGSTTTDQAGDYAVFNLKPGTYDIEISAAGFNTQTVTDQTVIAGQTLLLNFSLTPSGCAYTISPSQTSFAGNGGAGSFDVMTQDGCGFSAISNDSWITITQIDNGTVSYSVAANSASTIRNGTITVAGQTFTVFQGINFNDVPVSHPFYTEIGRLSARSVTLGCDAGLYCPDLTVTRQQMAAFIIRALGEFNPPPPAMQRFADVPPSNPFYAFIEQMAVRQITLGCAANMYCPTDPVLRDQMAAFIIRALHEPGYIPPQPAMQRFPDVPPSNPFYAHIEEMAIRQITLGCGGGNYCPSLEVSRGQMAAFLVRAFNL